MSSHPYPISPEGVLHPGWRIRLLQIERPRPGLRVLRVGALVRSAADRKHPRSRWQRIAAYLTFTALASLTAAWHVRPRLIFAVLQPLTVVPVLVALAHAWRARLVFNVQDLHPDAAVSLGLIRNRLLIRLLKRLERWGYRRADALTVICRGFREHCVAHGADPQEIRIIPNWIDCNEVRPQHGSVLRAELGLRDDAFVALYAGTIGYVSGARVVVEAAAQLQSLADLHIVFVGEGPLVGDLQREVDRRQLQRVHFLPFQPRQRLNDVQATGDVSVVTLLKGHGRTSVPSKVLGYMAAARAVVAAVDVDSETAVLVAAAGAGLVVEPENPAALAAAVRSLREDRTLARKLGESGRRYWRPTSRVRWSWSIIGSCSSA